MSIGGTFAVEAKLGDSIVPGRITESLQSPRAVTAHLLLQQAGHWTTAVSFHSSSPEDADVSTVIALHVVEVEEGLACASCCRLLGFWPVQGAIADVPAGFIIQVCSSYTGYIEMHHCKVCLEFDDVMGLQVESDEICDIVCRERNRLAGTSTATFACLHAQQCYADLALAVMSAIGTGSMPNFTAPFQCSQKCPEEMSAACMSYVSRNHAKLLGLTEIGTWL